MTRQLSVRKQEPTGQGDLKKVQQREQDLLEKLASASFSQRKAIQRFAG